jgi:PncC family amidohydrolase
MDAVHEVYSLLLSRSMHVSFAESCTGGLLSSRLVDIPGASNVFDESYVTYSNESKRRLLGVKSETLQKHGAVSEECALEMALGALKASGADYALSVTGIAGPGGGTPQKPVGLVYIGVADKRGAEARRCQFDGDRGQIRRAAADEAYALLLKRMRGEELN